MPHNLAAFANQSYLNLRTYKKDGSTVDTPVWFAEDASGDLYCYSEADAFKVKRIRNNPKVQVAPCDVRGNLRGEWQPAVARIAADAEDELGHRLLDKKYWLKRLGNWYSRLRGYERAVIAISLV